MNKLNILRDKEAKKWENTADQYNETFLVKTGWDALEALNLPVLFAEWTINVNIAREQGKWVMTDNKNFILYTTKELYNYWINNELITNKFSVL